MQRQPSISLYYQIIVSEMFDRILIIACSILGTLILFSVGVIAQDPCSLQNPADVQLTGRICFGQTCLDAEDFTNLKVLFTTLNIIVFSFLIS